MQYKLSIMKTNKEYPATHSMSTAWFAADEDGNVGIFKFGDNGPVPECISGTQDCVDDFLYDAFVETKDTCPYRILNLTDEQALDFYDKSLKKLDRYDDWILSVVVKIKKEMENIFFDEISKMDVWKEVICLSQSLGLYYIDSIKEPSKKLYDSIDDIRFLDLYISDMFNRTDSDTAIEFNKLPYYVYAQPYNRAIPITRLIKPKSPVKKSQLPDNVKDKIVSLPIRFSETETLQIAEYFISDWSMWDKDEKVELPIEISENKKLVFTYYKLSDGQNSFAYYLNSCPLAEKEKFAYLSYSYQSTILMLSVPGNIIKNENKKLRISATPAFYLEEQHKKLFWSELETIFRNMTEEEKVAKFQTEPIETIVKLLNPYLLIIDDDVISAASTIYKLENHQITINNQTFPYFLFSEMEQHRDEILEYSNKEYRGIKIPTKLTKDEIESLKH